MKFIFYHPTNNEINICDCLYGLYWFLCDEHDRIYDYTTSPETFGWELIGEL